MNEELEMRNEEFEKLSKSIDLEYSSHARLSQEAEHTCER